MPKSTEDIYRSHTQLVAPLALENHVQRTVRLAGQALRTEGTQAALEVLGAAVPRYQRLRAHLDG